MKSDLRQSCWSVATSPFTIRNTGTLDGENLLITFRNIYLTEKVVTTKKIIAFENRKGFESVVIRFLRIVRIAQK